MNKRHILKVGIQTIIISWNQNNNDTTCVNYIIVIKRTNSILKKMLIRLLNAYFLFLFIHHSLYRKKEYCSTTIDYLQRLCSSHKYLFEIINDQADNFFQQPTFDFGLIKYSLY